MRKLLFTAILIASTTLGFAKDNANTVSLEETKTKDVLIKQSMDVSEANLDMLTQICSHFHTYYVTRYETDMHGNTWKITDQVTDHYTYLCPDGSPRTTFSSAAQPSFDFN
ncbi:hypothetical protein ACFQO9_14805 [Chryseobacterium zhengzhouense]|uniref:Uncharacterized protein n=1 Tax=Chryseobacterium zhengzhouense TaxID=1636086 RepID=A0ABW2M1E9_9FLAO